MTMISMAGVSTAFQPMAAKDHGKAGHASQHADRASLTAARLAIRMSVFDVGELVARTPRISSGSRWRSSPAVTQRRHSGFRPVAKALGSPTE
jgi:hypothetical protein